MILPFKEQFREPIKAGTKKHSIREDKSRRWQKGHIIHFATGVRTKNYEQFHEAICTGVQDIEIKYTDMRGAVEIYIDGEQFGLWHRFMPEKSVNPEKVLQLARNDGFESVKDFLSWFQRDFKGRIIHWTDLKY